MMFEIPRKLGAKPFFVAIRDEGEGFVRCARNPYHRFKLYPPLVVMLVPGGCPYTRRFTVQFFRAVFVCVDNNVKRTAPHRAAP